MTDTFEVPGQFVPDEDLNTLNAGSDLGTAEPAGGDHVLPNGFIKLGLQDELLRAVEDLGYTEPTAVQSRVVPMAMHDSESDQFNDLMVSSQTGSGKTAAFLLPVLHTLLQQQQAQQEAEAQAWTEQQAQALAKGEPSPKRARRKDPTNPRNFKAATPGALVLCPTRELAQQVAHDAIELVKHCKGLRIANVVGGIPYALQIAKLQNANLVVATPGRLLDLQRSLQIKLDQVQFLVVDEADRMLDLGFADDLADINQLTVARRQTMMFSATFAPRIQQLASRVMREPQRVQIDSPQEKHAHIKQVLFWADNAHHKRKLLDHWLRDSSIDQAIVFASTQVECDGLANDLQQDGFSAVALHGALSQGLRNRRLMALRQGQVQILVATDVAARGIDVPSITHVFNYGLPMKAEDYTHRIGRTGRAGRDGLAVTLAEMRDRRKIWDIEAFTRQPFKAEVIPGLEPQMRMESRAPRADFGGRNRAGAGRFAGARTDRPQRSHGRHEGAGFGDRRGPRQIPEHEAGGRSDWRGEGRGDGRFDARADARGKFDNRGDKRFENRADNRFDNRADGARRAPQGFEGRAEPRFEGRDTRRSAERPAFDKPVRAGLGGKVFVPRDAKKRMGKPVKNSRG